MTKSVVFLDPRVPDLARLLGGLAPGTRGYVLDPARDGVRQVAEVLARDGLSGLAALSLVAHGRPGAIEFGATALDRESLDRHGPRLAGIGAALAPDGDVRLYACDVAFGTRGRAFVAALSSALGDAPVSASSRSVGSADLGGTWDLDASAGVVAVGAPFTLATLAEYRGVLAVVFSTGTNSTFPSIASTTRFLFGDFNGDGSTDILYQTGANGSQIDFAAGAGSGTFQTPIAANAAGSPFAGLTLTDFANNYYTGDFNGDGRLDVFVALNSGSKLYLSASPGSYSAVTGPDLPAPMFGTRVLVGDFNSDGKVDILSQTGGNGSQINYAAGNGNGTFQAAIAANAPGSPFAGVTLQNLLNNYFAADVDGDGDTDILVGSFSGSGTTLYINSAGGFTSSTSGNLPAPTAGTRMAVGDFDSDGKVDVLWQSAGNGTQINYSAGNGDGTFQTAIAANAAGSPLAGLTLPDFAGGGAFSSNYKVFDVDSDGDLDIVTGLAGSRPTYDVQGSDSGGDGSPPTLTSSTPADDAIGISPTADIVLTFDEAVTQGTGNIRIVRVSDRSVVQTIAVGDAAVSVSGSTVTIAHTALAPGIGYAIQLESGTFVDDDGAVYSGIGRTDLTTLNFTTFGNQAPVVTASGGVTAATEQVSVAVDTAVTVADADSATLASATVAVTGNFRSGEDVLAFTNTSAATYGNIAATYNAAAGTLTLASSGATATTAQFQAALRAVTYTDTSDTPNIGNRTISFTASDGAGSSSTVAKTVSVAAVNDAPVATAPASITVTEDVASALTGISFADADAAAAGVRATFTAAAGTLTAANGGGVAVTGSGTATLVLDGTIAAINTFVAGSNLAFTTASNAIASGSLTVLVSDLGNTGGGALTDSRSVTLDVTPVADTPGITGATTSEDAQTSTGLVVTRNAADGAEVGFVKVTNVQHGTVYLADGTTAVAAGSFITYAQANAGLKFTPAADFAGIGTFDVQASTSGSDAGLGGGVVTASVTVGAVNDAPTATGLTQTLTVAEDAAATNLFTAAPAVADVDNASVTATLTLANPAAGALTGAGAGTNGVYTITGTPNAVSTALAAVNFVPAANSDGTTSVAVAISDGQNGPQGANPTGTVSITVNAVNDAPTATGLTQTLTVAEDAAATKLFTAAPAVADVDSTSVTATLTLANAAAAALTGAGAGTNGVYTITDTPAQVATLLAAVTFTPAADYNGATNVAAAISDGQSGPQGANPAGTISITVSAVNDAPTVSAPAGPYAGVPGNAVAITGIGFADADAQGGAEQATFTVASGTLAATASSGVTIVGSTTSTLTATGTLADLNAFISGGHLAFTGAQGTTLGITLDDQGHTPAPARSGSGSVAIILDTPPTVPADADPATANTVAEGAGVGTLVGITARSTDADAGDAVSYALSVNSGGFFQIDPATGIVTVGAAGAAGLSHEAAASYVIQVRAADQQGVGSTSDFTIAVSNVAPTGAGDGYALDEDQALTVAAGTGVLANDIDPNGGTLTAILDAGPAHAGAFALNADGSFSYTPNADFNGRDSFAYHAFDGTAAGATVTVTLGVASVNDAPAGAGTTVTVAEDTAHVVAAADFGFGDAGDAGAPGGGNALAAVRIVTIPGSGMLTDDGTAVVAGQVISAADIAAGLLVFTPAADANGAASAAFTFQVQDDGGTARGGLDTDPTPRTLTIDVTPVNDPPVLGGDGAIAVLQGGSVVLTTADLTASDVDNTAAQLTYTVTATDHGSAVVGNAVVTSFTQAQLAAGGVSFRQDGTAHAASSLTVSVGDGTASASRTITATVDLAPRITGITSGSSDGTLRAGESATFVVTFSEAVTVTGAPTLSLSDGGTANLVAGAGTDTLTFIHTVQAGQNADDLSVTGLDLNGGSIRDGAAQDLQALPLGGIDPAGVIAVDTTAPTLAVASVSGATNLVGGHVLSGRIGAADAGSLVTVRDGASVLGTVTGDAQGQVSFALPVDVADGPVRTYALSLTATDAAGNLGTSDSFAFTLDFTPNRSLFGSVAYDPDSHAGEIYTLYDGLLGRMPDIGGGAYFLAAREAGATLHDIAQSLLTAPEFTLRFGDVAALSDRAFVDDLYRVALGREPDAQGEQEWLDALAHGTTRADVALGFAFSAENTGQLSGAFQAGAFVPDAGAADAARLYHGLLDRAPDAGGLHYAETLIHAGTSVATLAQAFLDSPEYASLHPVRPSDVQFVEGLYAAALGRAPDPAGEQSWLSALAQGASRATVAAGIVESPEAHQHLAGQIEAGWHFT